MSEMSGDARRPSEEAAADPRASDAKPSDLSRQRNYRTPEGERLGTILAKWCDDAEPAARLRMPELPPRCNSCAFRHGRHLANGSPYTQMDALKCVMEGVQFNCHQPDRDGVLYSGWAMMMLAKDGPDFRDMPWPFSNEAEER